MPRVVSFVILLAGTFTVSGCVSAQAPSSGSTPRPAPARPAPAAASSSVGADVVAAVNAERLRAGLRPLVINARLIEAARIQAEQMVKYRLTEHTIPGAAYPDMKSRFKAVGYVYTAAGENIAWNQASPRAATTAWMASRPHRANILDPRFTDTGVAMVRNARGEPYWVQVFGAPR